MTLAVSVPAPEPEAGLSVNQAALSLAVQLKVPPVLLIVTLCAVGLAAPWVAVKESAAGLAPMAGAAATVKVTGTVTVVALGALRVIMPLYVPTVRVPVTALSVTAPVPVPDAGLSDNQAILALALQLKVPPPALLIVMACVAGLAPPC